MYCIKNKFDKEYEFTHIFPQFKSYTVFDGKNPLCQYIDHVLDLNINIKLIVKFNLYLSIYLYYYIKTEPKINLKLVLWAQRA